MRDRVTTIFRRPSPELLAALESADKELQPAIAECEQRRQRLVALRDEGRSLLEELQEQIQANLQAASETMQQVEVADSDDAREDALAKKKACDEHVAVLQAQSHELGERLDELELQLAKADADLATLQSQQVAVQGRMAIVKQPTRRISPAFMAAIVVLLAGLIATPFLWNYFVKRSPEVEMPPLAVAPFDAEQARQHQENWAKYLGVPVEKEIDLGGGQKLTMVLIPPGEFRMGSTQAEQIRFLEDANADQYSINRIPSEGPEHRVRITKPFWVSRYEVTRGQFGQFVQQTGYKTDAERNGKGGSHVVNERWVHDPRFIWSFDLGFAQSEDHPVVNISWNDAIAFCRWLSNKMSGHIFLLPTEAQWEYVCRAGTTTCWHCGDNEDDLLQYGWSRENSDGSTHPVGQLKPNAFGLYDLHGNVWEWCADWRGREYYASSPTSDPTGKPSDSFRVHRGGNWVATADKSRSAFRGDNVPEGSGSHLGFRPILVLEVPDKAAESKVPPSVRQSSELATQLRPRIEGSKSTKGIGAFLVTPPDQPPNTLTAEEERAGWSLLFDGKTTDGWIGYNSSSISNRWRVENGAFVAERGAMTGLYQLFVITEQQFADFELRIQWKAGEGDDKYDDGGIKYRVVEGPWEPSKVAPEMQVLSRVQNDGLKLWSAGALWGLYAPQVDVRRPAGEWNDALIIAQGRHVEHWLNGVKLLECEIGSDDWNKRVQQSKFKDMPRFGTYPQGGICLQINRGRVEYRNIKIRVLSQEAVGSGRPVTAAQNKVETFTHVRKFTGHTTCVHQVCFSPDGRWRQVQVAGPCRITRYGSGM